VIPINSTDNQGSVVVGSVHNLQEIKRILAKIEDPLERDILEAALLSPPAQQRQHIIVLLHGMNTDAEWQEALADQLRDDYGVETYPIGYGNFSPLKFLFPIWTRRAPIKIVTQELRALKTKHPNADVSVIAHSFGSYILCNILESQTDLKFFRIQLCGAVVSTNYRWDKVESRVEKQIVNDVGHRDIWPLVAKISTWGFGDSGTFGFKKVHVRDRFFNYGHSDFMTREHVVNFWKPFIVDGQIKSSPTTMTRTRHGFFVQVLRMIPIKLIWIVVPAVIMYFLLK
jgi:hypothetical protein